MASGSVTFEYHPGLAEFHFDAVRLCGKWDDQGNLSADWSFTAMQRVSESGQPSYWRADVSFADRFCGMTFVWGVQTDGPAGMSVRGIAAEVDDVASADSSIAFTLQDNTPPQRYFLTWCARLGVNRVGREVGAPDAVSFNVWALNAQKVSLVLADKSIGYVADDGTGTTHTFEMSKQSDDLEHHYICAGTFRLVRSCSGLQLHVSCHQG
ncbi:1,4-alpha-glucan branching enzyme [Candidatus Burkholderia humilis]|nr:1,4-alpha-glucan branching enzyme [Candidatus Burkholderia humilis]